MSDCSPHWSSSNAVDILLVEDNPGDVRLIEEAFGETESEMTIHPVTTGENAVDFLKQRAAAESPSLPDLVLVDLNLPRSDGCAVIEAIRADSRLEPLPLLVLTSSTATEDIERCYHARANAYMTKPTALDEFVALAKAVERFWFSHAQFPSIPQ